MQEGKNQLNISLRKKIIEGLCLECGSMWSRDRTIRKENYLKRFKMHTWRRMHNMRYAGVVRNETVLEKIGVKIK